MSLRETIAHADSHDQTCTYCGAEFHVRITKQSAHNEQEDYSCPECGKQYDARASMPIRTVLISPRTDGRTDRYQNSD